VAKVYGEFSSSIEEEGGKSTVFITRSDFRKLLRAIALPDNRVQMPYVEQLYDELVQAQYKAMVRIAFFPFSSHSGETPPAATARLLH
jgi:hypothetical protein